MVIQISKLMSLIIAKFSFNRYHKDMHTIFCLYREEWVGSCNIFASFIARSWQNASKAGNMNEQSREVGFQLHITTTGTAVLTAKQ